MYKINDNGVIKVMGHIPEGAEVLETMTILNAEDDFDLVRIATEENVGSSIWLRNGDVKENYEEVEHEIPVE